MKKPCNRAFAITAGSIFLFAGLTLTILTIINLVQTLLSLFNGYSLPNQNVFINLLTITGYFLVGVGLLMKKKTHLLTAAFSVLIVSTLIRALFMYFTIVNILGALVPIYALLIVAFSIKDPPNGFARYSWFVPALFQLVYFIFFLRDQVVYLGYFRGGAVMPFIAGFQIYGGIIRVFLLVVAYLLGMLWVASPVRPLGMYPQPMMQGQPYSQPVQPMMPQGQPWQGQPGQGQGSQGEMVRWTTQPWQAPQGQPQPWQQPTQPVQQSQPWQAPPQVQPQVQQPVQQPVQPQTWQQPQNPQQGQ
ncbi:MAG: hypothetical protein II642_05975 [Firmicutes bacterium]|nr:hypothetical protein [Bacillota bacterium]